VKGNTKLLVGREGREILVKWIASGQVLQNDVK